MILKTVCEKENFKMIRMKGNYYIKKYYGDYMTPVKEKNNHEDRIILNPYKPYTEVLAELRDNN